MNTCKQCGKPVESKAGKRKKEFCNVNCRNKFFYAQRRQLVELGKKSLIPLPESYVLNKNVGILKDDGFIEPFFKKGIKNTLKNDSEEAEELKSNIYFKEFPKDVFDAEEINPVITDEPSLFQQPAEEDIKWAKKVIKRYGSHQKNILDAQKVITANIILKNLTKE